MLCTTAWAFVSRKVCHIFRIQLGFCKVSLLAWWRTPACRRGTHSRKYSFNSRRNHCLSCRTQVSSFEISSYRQLSMKVEEATLTLRLMIPVHSFQVSISTTLSSTTRCSSCHPRAQRRHPMRNKVLRLEQLPLHGDRSAGRCLPVEEQGWN